MKYLLHENMAHKIFSVLPDTKVRTAFEFMKEKRIRHLLVVDRERMVVGIISDRDFQRALKTEVETTEHLKIIAEHFDPAEEVQDYMSWEICQVDEDTSLKQVAYILIEKKISSTIVTDLTNRVVGLITTEDLLWVLVHLLEEKDQNFLENLKSKVMSSPLGSIANALSQSGI